MKRTLTVLAVILALLVLGLAWAFASGLLVLDHSATRVGEGFRWQGVLYLPCSADCTEGRTIAMTDDGWRINAVEEDDSHTFLVMRSFLDQWVCVREDYVIPTEGELTAVFWDGKRYTDPALLGVIKSAMVNFRADIEIEDDHIERITENRHLNALTFAYNDCPVGIYAPPGYQLGLLDGSWVLARRASGQTPTYGELMTYEIYTIPANDAAALAPYQRSLE